MKRRLHGALVGLFACLILVSIPALRCSAEKAPAAVSPLHVPEADPAKTVRLTAETDVPNKNVAVDAVLLPYSVARRIFGTEVAKHYAIIQLVISNHDQGDAMILQSVVLDYTHWLFSGTFADLGQTPKVSENLTPNQSSNTPFQIASAESRLVRAELQDAQQWTARNWTIRSAVLIGATAVGYQFLFASDFAKGSNAFNGALVPGLQQIWPDNTVAQINHISDFGFGTNHVIPKNSSDVVVAFFPLDRFITPSLQEIFRKAPAAYFNPSEMLVDPGYRASLLNLLRRAGALETPPTKTRRGKDQPGKSDDSDARLIANAIMHYEQFKLTHPRPDVPEEKASADLNAACTAHPSFTDSSQTLPSNFNEKDCLLLTLLNKVSLNNIRVIASGIMAVDTIRIPPVLTTLQFSSDAKKPETWTTNTKAQTATLSGTFLSGAQPSIAATDLSGGAIAGPVFDRLTVDALQSDDNHLVFTYTLPATIAPDTALAVTAVKKAKDGSQVQSAALPYDIHYTAPAAAAPAAQTTSAPDTAAKGGAGANKPADPKPASSPAAGSSNKANTPAHHKRPAAPAETEH